MAQITVFVDDAVRGTLPEVCVKEGVPTTDRLVVREALGDRASLGVAWLLLLLGPVGWIGLLIMAIARGARAEVLTVEVPMSGAAYRRLQAARQRGRQAVMVGAIAFVMAVLSFPGAVAGSAGGLGERSIALGALAAMIVAIGTRFVADQQVRTRSVGVDLDASRRWVTLSGVHPAFASACEAAAQRHDQRA